MKVLHRRWLLLLLILFVSGLVLTVPACFIFESAKNLIANELGKNAVNIAAAAATFMESDIEFLESLPVYRYTEGENGDGAFSEHPVFIEPESGGGGAALPAGGDSVKGELGEDTQYNQYLNQLITRFDKLEQETGAERIYCEKRISDMEKGYVIEQADLPAGHFSGKMIEEERIAFNKGIRTASGLKTDKDIGEYIIGYAPVVKRPSGETIGVVVVELSLEYAQNLISQTLYILLISFAAIALLVSLVISGLLQSRIKYHSTDDLTELYNKRYFGKHLKRTAREARYTQKPLALIMIDIDRFKQINDQFGHLTGDHVLRLVSQIMLKCTRSSDACCRYGGDEFAVILPNTDIEQAAAIANRILNEMNTLILHYKDGGHFHVSLSIGVAQYDDVANAEALIRAADQSLYVSKNSGRNKVTLHNSETLGAAKRIPEGEPA